MKDADDLFHGLYDTIIHDMLVTSNFVDNAYLHPYSVFYYICLGQKCNRCIF